jgi:uncharacterized SAM-binding protein YcdF (DUF218 family)
MMDLFFNALKGQLNSLNLILLLLIVGFIFHRVQKKRLARVFYIISFLFFVLTSTHYFPAYIIKKLESRYSTFNLSHYPHSKEQVYVHALGGGYTSDSRLEANAKLSWPTLGRLTEAIRIARLFDNSILVLSGTVASGNETLASVERRAAILFGFDSTRIITLETPGTTQEEAEAFVKYVGRNVNLILVTDALHLPRGMLFFRERGLNPYPAPTNFFIKMDENPFAFHWLPSVENMLLMDRVWREWLGSVKGYFFSSATKSL